MFLDGHMYCALAILLFTHCTKTRELIVSPCLVLSYFVPGFPAVSTMFVNSVPLALAAALVTYYCLSAERMLTLNAISFPFLYYKPKKMVYHGILE